MNTINHKDGNQRERISTNDAHEILELHTLRFCLFTSSQMISNPYKRTKSEGQFPPHLLRGRYPRGVSSSPPSTPYHLCVAPDLLHNGTDCKQIEFFCVMLAPARGNGCNFCVGGTGYFYVLITTCGHWRWSLVRWVFKHEENSRMHGPGTLGVRLQRYVFGKTCANTRE